MPTTIVIGYADGTPLETAVSVDLLVNGTVVGTSSPDSKGNLTFAAEIPAGSQAALRLDPGLEAEDARPSSGSMPLSGEAP